jgi:K+-sensing histidine kinase KdpD
VPRQSLTPYCQPFERLVSQPESCADGIGLGLAIVQSIADARNATVAARARAGDGLKSTSGSPRA